MGELATIEKLVDLESPTFSKSFVVVDLLPSLTFLAAVASLLMAGAPGDAPSGARFTVSLSKLSSTSVGLCTVGGFVLATALHPLALWLRRILSGNSTVRIMRPVLRYMTWRQRRRFKAANRRFDMRVARNRAELNRLQEVCTREFPAPAFLAPSRLGNALEALRAKAEGELTPTKALDAGYDGASYYRDLYLRARDQKLHIADELDDGRLKIAAAERYTLVWLIVGIVYCFLLHAHGWWLLLALVAFGLARLSYLGAVLAVVDFSYRIDDMIHIVGSELKPRP